MSLRRASRNDTRLHTVNPASRLAAGAARRLQSMARMLVALIACVIVVAFAVVVGEIIGDRRRLRDRRHQIPDEDEDDDDDP